MKILQLLTALILTNTLVLSGCSTVLELPSDGPTTLEVYRDHVGSGLSKKREADQKVGNVDKGGQPTVWPDDYGSPPYLVVEKVPDDRDSETFRVKREVLNRQSDLSRYTRADLTGRVKKRFPKLPNAEFTMYVFPHISKRSGLLIPLYATNWMLYEKTHYAKPGETVSNSSNSSNK